PVTAPQPLPSTIFRAWPRSAQLATAFLLGVALALLGVQILGHLRWGSRPTELQAGAVPLYRIDLNQADRIELAQLPGVGEQMAGRIVDHRREKGNFGSVDELAAVRGVGPATLERVRGYVRIEAESRSLDGPPAKEVKPKSIQQPSSTGRSP